MANKRIYFVLTTEDAEGLKVYFTYPRKGGQNLCLPYVQAESMDKAIATLKESWGIVSKCTPAPLGTVCYVWVSSENGVRTSSSDEEWEVYHLPSHGFVSPLPEGVSMGVFSPAPELPNVPQHDRPWLEMVVALKAPFHVGIEMFNRARDS